MDVENPVLRWIYIATAAIGGAIVSLSFTKWQTMPLADRSMTILVGVLFAIFGVPWLVGDLMQVDIAPLRVACGITFFGAAGAPTFIPLVLRFFRRTTGIEESSK